MMVRSLKHLLALLLYSVLTLIMTWPALLRLKVAIIGDHIDSYLNTWIIAWGIHKLTAGEFSSLFDANIFFPYPNTLAYSEHLLGVSLLGVPIQLGFGRPFITFNILVLLGFVLTAWAMYFLVWHLTRNGPAAFISGLLFAFFPWRFGHISHLQLLFAPWLPLTFLFLHRFMKTRSYRDLFGAASFFVLQFYSCGYYGLYLALFVGIFLLLAWLESGPDRFRLLGKFAVFFFFSLALILPGYLPYLKLRRDFGFTRPLEEAIFFSADILTYWSTPIENRLWGKALQKFGKPEGDLFIGLTAFLLLLIGLWAVTRRRKSAERPPLLLDSKPRAVRFLLWSIGGVAFLVFGLIGYLIAVGDFSILAAGLTFRTEGPKIPVLVFMVLIGLGLLLDRSLRHRAISLLPVYQSSEPRFYGYLLLISFLLTLGPIIHFNGQEITYGPYLLLYHWVPGFDGLRVPSRFIIMLDLAVSVLSGFGLARILNRIRSSAFRVLLGTAIALLVLVEYASFPVKMPSVPIGRDFPQVYTWLSRQPGDFALLELPLPAAPDELWREAVYVYFSTYHWKKLVNGFSGFFPPGYNRLYLEDLRGFPSEETLKRMHHLGIRYLIIHSHHYPPAERDKLMTVLNAAGELFILEKQFQGDLVYRAR